MSSRELEAQKLQKEWSDNPRWRGIKRGYTAAEVVRLRGSVHVEHTLAKRGSEKLWDLITTEPFVNSLGALTGNQAMQQVKAGLKAIYLSGWQVAGDANLAGEMYPDQSLYPINSVPQVVKKINNALTRCDQIQWMEGKNPGDAGYTDYFAPIVADAEADTSPAVAAYFREVRFPVDSDDLWAVVSLSPLGYPHDDATRTITARLAMVDVGKARILTIPGEALPNIGAYLKRKAGDDTFLFGLTNDAFGYILTKEDFLAFPRYQYVSRVSLGERTGTILVDNLLEMVGETPRPGAK